MIAENSQLTRLHFLARVVERESVYLNQTAVRLFGVSFTLDAISRLHRDVELSERVDAFVARFGRLQDTLGDKLLPALLIALGEKAGAAIDNMDKAERFGWLPSSSQWMVARTLRNQMVHDYVEDPLILYQALTAGHGFVPLLVECAAAMRSELVRRGFIESQ